MAIVRFFHKEQAGTTSHQFILQAIAEKTAQAELQSDFHAVADARYADIVASGETISWADMRGYLESRMAGKVDAPKPIAKKLAR